METEKTAWIDEENKIVSFRAIDNGEMKRTIPLFLASLIFRYGAELEQRNSAGITEEDQ